MSSYHIYKWEGEIKKKKTINTEGPESFITNSKQNRMSIDRKMIMKFYTHTHSLILPETLFKQKELQHLTMADSGLTKCQIKGFLHLLGREHCKNQVKIKEPEAKQSLDCCLFSWVLPPRLKKKS